MPKGEAEEKKTERRSYRESYPQNGLCQVTCYYDYYY